MQLYILNPNYEIIGIIDEAESVLWGKKYNDIGYCEVYTAVTEYLIELLRKGNYIYRYDDTMFCKVETVGITTDVEKGDYIVATGNDISKILAGRIVQRHVVFSGTVAEFFRIILNENVISPTDEKRAITNFEIDDSNFSIFANDIIEVSTEKADLLQLILTTCKAYKIGFRLSYNINTQKLVFGLYKGKNKATTQSDEYVEFSPAYANIVSSNYNTDDSNYKNVAFVGYKDINEALQMLIVYSGTEPQGEERKEIYIDGTSTSRDITSDELLAMFPSATLSGTTYYITVAGVQIAVATVDGDKITVTDYTYEILIRNLGISALATHIKTQAFSGAVDTIDTYDYKIDYDLGDYVNVINDYGISAVAQITEILESEDSDNGYECEPKFEYI